MRVRMIAGAAVASALFFVGSASAEEQNLKYRLVVMDTSVTDLEAPNVPGRTVGVAKSVGVATFEDGRIAYKNFIRYYDGTEAAGDFTGYSTFTFENGDSLTMKFVAKWSDQGFGGDYEVISGTGAYAGATGIGHFDGAETQPWEGADLLNGWFKLEVPGA